MRGNIMVFTGPPGSGKTSAMAIHHAALTAKGNRASWLTLTLDDNEPAVLHNHILQAFFSPSEKTVSHLGSGANLNVFIDGIDRLVNPDAQQLIEQFILGATDNNRFYIATKRMNGPLFHDGLLRGVISVISQDDLRFNDEDAKALLKLDRRASEITRLNDFVDGWAAGLRFLSRAPEAVDCLLIGNSEDAVLPEEMSNYFDDVVCSAFDPMMLNILSELSVIGRLPIRLITEMQNGSDSWLLLEDQIRQGSFVHYTDKARSWIAFHPALARHLRSKLLRHSPKRYNELRHFAAKWFKQNGYLAEAIRHAVNITERPLAARLIESAGAISVDLSNGPDVRLESTPTAEMAVELPLLFLGQIYNLIRHGKHDEARRFFNEARQETANFTNLRASSDADIIRSWAHLIAVLFSAIDDQHIATADIEKLEDNIRKHIGTEPILAAGIASVLAFIYLDQSRHAESLRICQLGQRTQNDPNNNRVTVFLLVHQASNAIARDTLDTAITYIEKAQQLAGFEGDDDCYEVLLSQIMRAILHYEKNELKSARHLLSPALDMIASITGWVRLYSEAYSTAAALASILDGKEAMEKLIHTAETFAYQRALPRLSANLQVTRLREYIRVGDWRSAMAEVETAPLADFLASDHLGSSENVDQIWALIEAARLMLELGRIPEANAFLQRISKPFLDKADSRLRHIFHSLSMRAHFGLRRYGLAIQHLQLATDIARQSGLIRRALEEGNYVLEVFDWSERHGRNIAAANIAFIETTLRNHISPCTQSILGQSKPKSPLNQTINNYTLSPRETEIITLMAEGLINKEIATRLGISEGTVKTHRKKIHEKLGVSSRSQAIQKARELLLV